MGAARRVVDRVVEGALRGKFEGRRGDKSVTSPTLSDPRASREKRRLRVLAVAFWAILLGMRVGLLVVSACVASTGAALAQSDWVVDPWSRSARMHESATAMGVDAPPAALDARPEYDPQRGWLDEWSVELDDPWTSAAATAPAAAHPVPAEVTRESGEWAKPVPLVVDPWATAPARSSAPVVDLIVDPWAHE